jgi:hypothetical protein
LFGPTPESGWQNSVANSARAENVARQIGKLAPSNPFSTVVAGAGGYFGDPLLTAGMWKFGAAGKGTAIGLTANGFNQVRNALLGSRHNHV